jgi:hypothetical protein
MGPVHVKPWEGPKTKMAALQPLSRRQGNTLLHDFGLDRLILAEISSIDLRDTPAFSANVGHLPTAL